MRQWVNAIGYRPHGHHHKTKKQESKCHAMEISCPFHLFSFCLGPEKRLVRACPSSSLLCSHQTPQLLLSSSFTLAHPQTGIPSLPFHGSLPLLQGLHVRDDGRLVPADELRHGLGRLLQ